MDSEVSENMALLIKYPPHSLPFRKGKWMKMAIQIPNFCGLPPQALGATLLELAQGLVQVLVALQVPWAQRSRQ